MCYYGREKKVQHELKSAPVCTEVTGYFKGRMGGGVGKGLSGKWGLLH